MKLKNVLFGVALFLSQFSFAGSTNFPVTSDSVLQEIFKYLSVEELKIIALVDRRFSNNVPVPFLAVSKARVEKIEMLMNRWGFTPLPEGEEIYNAGITQELWVEVMGNNPSYFKEQKYCPGSDLDGESSYKEILIDGVKVSMCRNFPVVRVIAVNQGKKDSDVEFIEALNQIYQEAEKYNEFRKHPLKVFEFRRANRIEYNYADTEDQANPKLRGHADLARDHLNFLGKFTPYWQISDRDPVDLNQKSPSRERQSRSILSNAPNHWGFRRAGVWEWVEDMDGSCRGLVGGSWISDAVYVLSGYPVSDWPDERRNFVGPSRLVRTQK